MPGAELASKKWAPESLWLAVYLFGGASIVAGILDLVWGEFEAAHQPIAALGDYVPLQPEIQDATSGIGGVPIQKHRIEQVCGYQSRVWMIERIDRFCPDFQLMVLEMRDGKMRSTARL